jgi:hypothetical protein
MKEDLNITGNQYTYMGTIYNAVSAPLLSPRLYPLTSPGHLCDVYPRQLYRHEGPPGMVPCYV